MIKDRVEWIEFAGEEILYVDYRDLNDKELIQLIKYADDLITNSDKKDFLKINDIRGLYATASILSEIKRSSKLQRPYIKKSAYIGITGVKRILLMGINRISSIGAKPFTNIEEAKEWLVE